MESASEQTFTELQELFGKIKAATLDATTEAGDSDCDKETFNSYEELVQKIDETLAGVTPEHEHYLKLLCMKGSILYEKAKLYMQKGLEIASTENLQRALEVIKAHVNDDNIKFLQLRIINHLSYLLSRTGDHKSARLLLEEVEKSDISANIKVYTTEELFTVGNEPDQSEVAAKLEKIVVNNLQMLSWIYGKSGMVDEQIIKSHEALQRQLDSGDTNCSWALRAARLSTVLLSRGYWDAARHHLSAATSVITSWQETVPGDKELQRAQADLARAWVYYGLQLFSTSKACAMENLYANSGKKLDDLIDPPNSTVPIMIESTTTEPTNRKWNAASSSAENIADETVENESAAAAGVFIDGPSTSSAGLPMPEEAFTVAPAVPYLRFENLDVSATENAVICRTIASTEEARALFLHTQSWLKTARMFYTLRDYPLEYINAVLNLSELYRYLAYYEEDTDSQYNVQKRRAETLETLCSILREARPQCYTVVSVELLRELAEVQLEMMGLNLRRLYMLPVNEPQPSDYKHRTNAILDLKERLEHMGDALGKTQFLDEPVAGDRAA